MLTWCFLGLRPSSRSRHVAPFSFAARFALVLLLGSIFAIFSGACFADGPSDAGRIALLIANGNYPDANLPMQSAAKDGAVFADELTRDAFDVDLEKDLSRDGMRTALDAFLGKIKPGSTALLYFNGIGIQVARQTYLIPVNAEIWSEADVKREGTSLDSIVADMSRRGAAVKIIVIDASRRNPFERRFRAYSAGLAGIDAPENTLVMYASAPNKVGPDDTGDVSLFMNELVKEMRTPNISAEDAIMHTRVGVSRASNGEEVPWFASSLADPIFLGRVSDAAPPPADQSPPPPPVVKPPEPASSPPPVVKPSASPPPDVTPPKPVAKAPPVVPPVTPEPIAKARVAPPAPPKLAENTSGESKNTPPKNTQPTNTQPTNTQHKTAAPPPTAEPPATPVDQKTGAVFRDCPDCPELSVLAPGSFLMGSGVTPFDRPPHRVTLAKPFAMARSEVTFADWGLCMAGGGCSFKPDSQGFGEGDHPVINVSWTDAHDYVAWLSRKTGKPYRLPTEAEWEYAAHGGTTTAFAWGTTLGTHMANCSDCGGQDGPHTLPVRSFAPNAYGLYDMAGNAAEWVEDCWNASYRGAPKDGSAWLTGNCEQRVLRGGSFDSTAAYIKPSARFRYDSDVRYWANGFRVLREMP